MNNTIINKYALTKRQEAYLAELEAELKKCSGEVTEKLSVLKRCIENQDVFQLLENKGWDTNIEFFHGMDGYDISCEAISLFDEIKENDWKAQQIFTKWYKIEKSLSYDEDEIDSDQHFLYKDIRNSLIWKKRELIFFKWFVKLWHQLEFHRNDIYAYTIQNNSVEMFDLNRCCWHNFLSEKDQNFEERYSHKFDFDFSDDEIEARISLKHRKPNITYWRHLKKGNKIHSFAIYEDIANIYSHDGNFENPEILEELEFEKNHAGLVFIRNWVDVKMIDGYREILIPEDIHWNITPEHLHFDMIKLSHPNILSTKEINELEKATEFQLPLAYRNFIANYHEAELKSDKIGFPIDDFSFGKLNRFFWNSALQFSLKEIDSEKYLIIADTIKGELISINEKDAIHLHHATDKILIAESFEEFLQSFFNYQFTPDLIELKAKAGDIDFFKNFIENNYVDQKTENGGATAIRFAVNNNQLELVKFLLENGASVDEVAFGWIPKDSEPMIDLLLEYGFDPHQWNMRNYPFFKSDLGNWIFKDKVSEEKKEFKPIEFQIKEHQPTKKDKQELNLIEEKIGIQLPEDFKTFILKHGGEKPNRDWFFVPINSGSTIQLDRFLQVDEILPKHDFLKSIECRSPFYQRIKFVPFATTRSHERIYLEFHEDKIRVDIENQYELRNFSSGKTLTKDDNCFSKFLDLLQHQDQLFYDDAKAIVENNVAYIQNLIDKKWDPNYSFRSFGSPLALAIYMNHFELVDILLENGAFKATSPKTYNVIHTGKPLIYAMKMGTPEMVEHLLNKGILEFDVSSDYLNIANALIEKNGRSYLKKFLPRLQSN